MFFMNKKREANGMIGYFSLQDWWFNELDKEDRASIEAIYKPMGGREKDLTEGDMNGTSLTKVGFLSGMIGWFSKEEFRHIAYKLIDKAERSVTTSTKPLDLHFLFNSKIEITYKDRECSSDALNEAIKACKQQISMADRSVEAFRKQYKNSPLPSHRGYKQLAIWLEKQKDYVGAIEVAKKAKLQGWSGDWDKRIERCSKKNG